MALPCLALLAPLAANAAVVDRMFDNIRAPAGVTLTAVDPGKKITIVLSLPMKDEAGARAFGESVSDPKSPMYGHYLTPAEFGARFGGDPATYEYLRNWATANGLTPGQRTAAKIALSVTGTARQFASLFHTSFASFMTAHNGEGRVTLSQPRLPAELNGRVKGVVGLSSGAQYAPLARLAKAGPRATNVGTGVDGTGYDPSDFRTAYDVPSQKSSTQTEVVGIFEQAGFRQSEITTFETAYGLPNTPISAVSVDGSKPSYNFEVDLEVVLDIDTVIGQNPDVSQIIVYAASVNTDFSTALIDAFNTIGDADVAKVINISYGLDENQQGASAVEAEGAALVQLEDQGQSVFVSAGDDGAAGREGTGLNAPDPGSQPLVTSVGGTTMNTVTAGGAYASEVTWNDLASGEGATGGGVSDVWSIPSYQIVHGKSIALKNGGSSTFRNVPDVAADADPETGASVYCTIYGGWVQVGGTSLAAPLWTAWVSIINADRVAKGLPRVGFVNPLLYPYGSDEGLIGFHDITSGNNGSPGYTAGIGYDNVTGFGSIDVAKLIPFATK
jgi:kumamolisin